MFRDCSRDLLPSIERASIAVSHRTVHVNGMIWEAQKRERGKALGKNLRLQEDANCCGSKMILESGNVDGNERTKYLSLLRLDELVRTACRLFDVGDHERATAECNEAIRMAPADPYPYFVRACSQLAAGDNQGALADFELAASVDLTLLQVRTMTSEEENEWSHLMGCLCDTADSKSLGTSTDTGMTGCEDSLPTVEALERDCIFPNVVTLEDLIESKIELVNEQAVLDFIQQVCGKLYARANIESDGVKENKRRTKMRIKNAKLTQLPANDGLNVDTGALAVEEAAPEVPAASHVQLLKRAGLVVPKEFPSKRRVVPGLFAPARQKSDTRKFVPNEPHQQPPNEPHQQRCFYKERQETN